MISILIILLKECVWGNNLKVEDGIATDDLNRINNVECCFIGIIGVDLGSVLSKEDNCVGSSPSPAPNIEYSRKICSGFYDYILL